jgi:hypothetical protein
MNDLPKNELFSAYLDGELTAAERAQVEQLLATDPAARQLLEELRAVSNTLQSLPQQKVGEDLGPHVLRMAERRILTDQQPKSSSRIESAPVPLGRAIFRRFTSPRILAWTAITTVLAIVVWVDEQRRGDMKYRPLKEVAMAERPLSGPLPPSSISAAPAKNKVALDGKSDSSVESSQGSPYYMQDGVSNPKKEDKGKEDKGREEPTDSLPAPMAKSELASDSQPNSNMAGKLAEATATQDAEKREQSEQGPATYAAGKQSRVVVQESEESVPLESVASAPTSPAAPKPLATAAEPSKPVDSSKQDDFQFSAPPESSSNNELVVVECEISPEAVKNQAFDKLLSANSIVMAEGPQGNVAAYDSNLSRSVAGASTTPPPSQPATPQESKDEKSLSEESRSEKKPESGFLAKSPNRENATSARDDKFALKREIQEKSSDASRVGGALKPAENKTPEDVDVVYVEATPDQVEATLAGMAAKPEEFPSVSVQFGAGEGSNTQLDKQPVAANTQALNNRFSQYNRVTSDLRQSNQQAAPQQAVRQQPGLPSNSAETNSAETAEAPAIQFSERNPSQAQQPNQNLTQGFAQRVQAQGIRAGGRWTLDFAQQNGASNRQAVVTSQPGRGGKAENVQNTIQILNRSSSLQLSNQLHSNTAGDVASPAPTNASVKQSGEENSLKTTNQIPPMQRVVFVLHKAAPSASAEPATSSPSDRPQDTHP